MKKNKGITLIALIITIIIMLILVGVTVSVLIDSNLLGNAKTAADATRAEYDKEKNLGSTIKINGEEYSSIEEYVGLSSDRPNGKLEISYEMEGDDIYLTTKYINNDSYEAFAERKLQNKTPADLEEMLIAGSVFWFPEDFEGIENVTLEDVLNWSEAESINMLVTESGFNTLEEFLIANRCVCPGEYDRPQELMSYEEYVWRVLPEKTRPELKNMIVEGMNWWNETYGDQPMDPSEIAHLMGWSDLDTMISSLDFDSFVDTLLGYRCVEPWDWYVILDFPWDDGWDTTIGLDGSVKWASWPLRNPGDYTFTTRYMGLSDSVTITKTSEE